MAGGVGSRFWPMSTAEMPKQFIDVLGIGKSMIQMTVERFDGVIPQENVWVVTSQRYKNIVMEQLPMVPDTQILLEPCMRNTAPCIEYVSRKIYARYPDANLVFSPADHIVMDVPEFKRVISESLRFTSNRAAILTLGMMPSRPETGYGYIKARDNENDTIKKLRLSRRNLTLILPRHIFRMAVIIGMPASLSGMLKWLSIPLLLSFLTFMLSSTG